MGLNLYEIKGEQLSILREVQEADGELSPELEARLMGIDAALDDKLEACCIVVKNMEAIIEAHKNEAKRLKEKQVIFENNKNRLENWIAGAVGPEGWKRGVHSLGWRKSKSVEIIDNESVPLEFATVETTYTPIKSEIKKLLESGVQVTWARLVEKQNLQVR